MICHPLIQLAATSKKDRSSFPVVRAPTKALNQIRDALDSDLDLFENAVVT